ncbi:MAG: hypothetical protein N2491_07030 [Negativicutes bacterium]|nr:hypothetical protein [Negativicutes bacterium]
MKNVYDRVRSFYEQEKDWQAPVQREWIEGFLRHKAWQGANDAELKAAWRQLELFILYLMYTNNPDLAGLQADDYRRAVEWLDRHVTGFTASPRSVRRLLSVLRDFFEYLSSRKIQAGLAELGHAASMMQDSKQFAVARSRLGERDNRLSAAEMAKLIRTHGGDMEADLGRVLGETAETLMTKMGVFFQQDIFSEELQRALFLYSGPAEMVLAEESEEFWLGFWDYFLFDYHLLSNDKTPLAYFDAECGSSLSSEEKLLLTQLLAARFTVFYISKIVNPDWVECVNLFTEETFLLPMPDFGLQLLKKSLFYGHIFVQDMVMVNYVTSVEVSENLRRRIKEQIIKQKRIFEVQVPDASWDDFFARHSLAVRHTIDRMIHLAVVNVIPFALLDNDYLKPAGTRISNREVHAAIFKMMRHFGFSRHDIELAQRLWHDYSQISATKVRRPEIWAAAVVSAYSRINYPRGLSAAQLAADYGISGQSIYSNRKKIASALKLSAFDPRYLSEEGLVCALFLS